MIKQFDKDIESEFHDMFNTLRGILLATEGMIETKKPRITTYSDLNGGVCHMRTTAIGVDIGYLKGALFEDKFDLLTGSGKKMRVHKLYGKTALDFQAIDYYLQQAQRLNIS